MADLPALSEAAERVLKLHFEALLESFRLTGDAAGRYASAGDLNRRIASGTPPGSTSRYLKGWLTANQRAKQECGITSSVEVATRRFNQLAAEYFKLWSPSTGYDFFAVQLEVLTEQVLAEIKSIWQKSEVTAKWYESVCAPPVKTAVSARLKAFRDQARYSEMALLARSQLPLGKSDGPNPPLATPVSQTDKGPDGPRKKRGPKPDYEIASRVAEIVKGIAPDGKWRPKLDEICEALDEQKLPMPKTWKPKHGYLSWCEAGIDATARGRHMALEAIKHHLELAKEAPTETIP